MSDDVFGLEAPAADFLEEEPQAGDVQAEPEEVLSEGAVAPEGELSAPKVPEDDLYPGRPRDPETGRFVKAVAEKPPAEEAVAATESPVDERIWAGKYKGPDELEKGYRELRDLQRRTAERANAYEQRVQEVEFQARQMEDAVRRATEYVRSLQQQQEMQLQQPQQVLYDEMGNPVQLPPPAPQWTPEQMQPMVEQMLEQRMAAQAQAMQQQAWEKQRHDQAAAAQERFFEKHPEVERNGTLDEDIASTILALNEAWGAIDGSSFNIGSEESLDIALEATQRPALRTVLAKNPAMMDDDAGMELARALADKLDGRGTTQAPAPQPTRMTPRPNTPVVERGSSTAPVQQTPLDEFDQAVAEYRNRNKARGSDVFFS